MSTREMLNLLGLQSCTYDKSISVRTPIISKKYRRQSKSKDHNTPQKYTNEELIELFKDSTLLLNSLRERNKKSCNPRV